MYLEHFGLTEQPFRITPVTEFFFSGANRGEILDALIYSVCKVEGIVKVSGEVGSGKTMLCRMLLERLPKHIETIYLANPSLTREEMLYAIGDGLGLKMSDERVGVMMQNIQSKLEEKGREGKRVVVLVDEAHAMPLDTLEELRLLYNLQVGNAKLLQIVLFGQPELNEKLEQPNMRQLKDRIVHHFNMQPLSRDILNSYLDFRMRAAGYRGPNVFSPNAVKLIADASQGLMRRVNVLADKALLAAFVEGTHNIEASHIKTAIKDSELKPGTLSRYKKFIVWGIALLLIDVAILWLVKQDFSPFAASNSTPLQAVPPVLAVSAVSVIVPASSPVAASAPVVVPASSPVVVPENTAVSGTYTNLPLVPGMAQGQTEPPAKLAGSLYEQRLTAGKRLLTNPKNVASIQLFYNEEINPQRMEGFLQRADGLGKLAEIYILPAKFGKKDGIRILYSSYSSIEAARAGLKELPKRYQEAFATSIYVF
jgi:type II secretory pathway predicted ATPase ExeA